MRKYTSGLSVSGINKLANELEAYANSIRDKNETFIKRLCEEGIHTAEVSVRERMRSYILFEYTKASYKHVCKAVLIAKNKEMYKSSYYSKDENGNEFLKTVDVSPILMAEFGSGWRADVRSNVVGVGQGTFPDQTHATDNDGWWWKDTEGQWHHSLGEVPDYPMYNASVKMIERIVAIAREVFGT